MFKNKMNVSVNRIFILIFVMLFISTSTLRSQSTSYTQSGGTATKTNQTYIASSTDQSGVLVSNSGIFTLTNSTITTTGNSSNVNNSSQYGLNAGVLANSSGKITLTNCSITTSGSGANGLFASGSGSSITMSNGTIVATGGNAHGVDVTYTGTITLINVNITTSGASSSVLATDFGGGTVTVTGGTFTASATKSAGIYSTGLITVSGASITANGDNGAVIDADGSIALTNTDLTGSQNGLMIHNTVGQLSLKGIFTIDGGSLTAKGGDAFYVNGAKASITVKGAAKISASTANLVDAVSSSILTFIADNEKLTGNLISDKTSSVTATLQNGSSLTGYINSANTASTMALSLDATSSWTVTATSYLTSLSNPGGISGTSITNITGNGYNVYYNANIAANSYLGGKTYSLVNGGKLMPQTANSVIQLQSALPTTWLLNQNYPNPFNPSTKIQYSIQENSMVNLTIFNSIGKEITTLVNKIQAPGTYQIDWNAGNIPSGVYFYKLKTDKFDAIRKMILLK